MKSPLLHIALTVTLALTLTLLPARHTTAEESVDAALTSAITKLNDEQKAALLVLVNGIVAATAAQETPAEGAMKTVKAYVKAAEEMDVDALMAQISEHFTHEEVADKAALRAFVEEFKMEGKLEDITGNVAEAKTTVTGDEVTVYPVELEGLFGTITYDFRLKKEGDAWKIVGFEMTGL